MTRRDKKTTYREGDAREDKGDLDDLYRAVLGYIAVFLFGYGVGALVMLTLCR